MLEWSGVEFVFSCAFVVVWPVLLDFLFLCERYPLYFIYITYRDHLYYYICHPI